jgi:hypothetical protein
MGWADPHAVGLATVDRCCGGAWDERITEVHSMTDEEWMKEHAARIILAVHEMIAAEVLVYLTASPDEVNHEAIDDVGNKGLAVAQALLAAFRDVPSLPAKGE